MPPELAAFLAVLSAEIADKSMLVAFSLGALYGRDDSRRALGRVFLGYFAAILLNHGVTITVGKHLAPWLVDRGELFTGISLVACALLLLRGWRDEPEEGASETRERSPFFTAFALVSMAEWFDKTQIATAAFAVGYPNAAILPATVSAMMVIGTPSILFGRYLERRLASPILRGAAILVVGGLGVATIVVALNS